MLADTSISVPTPLLNRLDSLFAKLDETVLGIILALGIGEHRYDETDFVEWSSATDLVQDLLFELSESQKHPDRQIGQIWSSRRAKHVPA
jgi:hypothetical protein